MSNKWKHKNRNSSPETDSQSKNLSWTYFDGFLYKVYKLTVKAFQSVVLVLGFIASIMFFIPNVSISTAPENLNPNDPFETPFLVKNYNPIFPIYNVQSELHLLKYSDSGPLKMQDNILASNSNDILKIEAGHDNSLNFDLRKYIGGIIKPPVKEAIVEVQITYNPDFSFIRFWKNTDKYKFKGMGNNNGNMYWFPE